MRFSDLFENTHAWPETISGHDLLDYVEDWHHVPEDFEDGDIVTRIIAFGTYHLKRIPLSSLELNLYSLYDDLVDDYSARTTPAPPIVVDMEHGIIIDGNHRANAADKRGDTDILAYVGDPSTYAPDHGDDSEEWEPDGEEYGFVKEAAIDPSLRFPKPSRVIHYSDDGDEAGVWLRPSAGTVSKCIGNFDCRALLYENGLLVVWAQTDMYHRDVYDNLTELGNTDFITLMLHLPHKFEAGVAVKGESRDPVPFTDERWLALLHSNRTLVELYGDDFDVVEEDWF